jgi:DNA repair protein RadB
MDTVKNTFLGLGGTALEHISKVIIRLEKTDRTGFRRARLVKHRSQPEGHPSNLRSLKMASV